MEVGASTLWQSLDRLVDRAPSLEDLRAHRLHLYAAVHGRALDVNGRPESERTEEEERAAIATTLVTPFLLERVRHACEGPILLMKGPEVAAHYRQPHVRIYHDLDLLVPDSRAAQQQLIAEGFEEVGDPSIFVEIHHERPLWLPGWPVVIELH